MEQEPYQQESVVTRHPGGMDSKVMLIFATLVLFVVALYFEYKGTTIHNNNNEILLEQPVPVIEQQPPQTNTQKPALSLAQQFYQATARSDLTTMQTMINQLQEQDINAVTHGMTPIMKASSLGRVDMVEFLIEHGADPNKRGSSQRTALQYAAERNRLPVAKVLIKHGADINGVDAGNLSPLIMAADRRYHDFAMYLIDGGADVNIQHNQGWTALIDASVSGDVELVKRLLKEGANINARTQNGWTALDYAKHHKRYDVIPYLLEKQ
ncbi:MAG: ankyrin repeat domain-containing protein [Gammaproteobacteria bacterium]